jgi:predicted TIM-barrel fold metal-dependent hydrolase
MIRSGVLERYPGLKLVMPHAGGVLPYLDGRLGYTPPGSRGSEHPINKRSVVDTLKNGNIWYDLANPSEEVIAFAHKYFTTEKLMYGSDYPFVEQKYLAELVERAVTSEAERDAINRINAEKVFSLLM